MGIEGCEIQNKHRNKNFAMSFKEKSKEISKTCNYLVKQYTWQECLCIQDFGTKIIGKLIPKQIFRQKRLVPKFEGKI